MRSQFLIVGHGRSGSSLLAESVSRHPSVHCYGEVFHNDLAYREAAFGEVLAPGRLAADFLRDVVFRRPTETGKPVVGCKLFFFHARKDPSLRSLWDYLAGRPDIGILLIERRNLFDAYVSQIRAQASGRWRQHPSEEAPPQDDRLVISPQECAQYMRVTLAGMEMLRRHFCRHEVHEVPYERLAHQYRETMAGCFGFLGVEPVAIAPPLVKMNTLPHPMRIENYAEVVEYFASTEFAPFFDTPDQATG